MLFKSLLGETGGNKTIRTVLQYAEKNLNVSINDKINYLLYIVLSGLTDKAIGNGIFYLGLMPDEKLAQRKEYAPSFLMKNDDCISVMSDFSSTIADRVVELPIKANSLQKEVAAFLKQNGRINTRIGLCQQILKYPSLNFSQWQRDNQASGVDCPHNCI